MVLITSDLYIGVLRHQRSDILFQLGQRITLLGFHTWVLKIILHEDFEEAVLGEEGFVVGILQNLGIFNLLIKIVDLFDQCGNHEVSIFRQLLLFLV